MPDLAQVVGRLEGEVDALRGWQKQQNGALMRLADKVDRLYYLAITTLVGLIVELGMRAWGQ